MIANAPSPLQMSGLRSLTPDGADDAAEEGSIEGDTGGSDPYLSYPQQQLPNLASSLGFGAGHTPAKRGPGRPRKDGMSPIARKPRG